MLKKQRGWRPRALPYYGAAGRGAARAVIITYYVRSGPLRSLRSSNRVRLYEAAFTQERSTEPQGFAGPSQGFRQTYIIFILYLDYLFIVQRTEILVSVAVLNTSKLSIPVPVSIRARYERFLKGTDKKNYSYKYENVQGLFELTSFFN